MSGRVTVTANPRQSACQVLLRIAKEGGFADRLIDRELEKGHLTGPDRGLFPELVFGVLRRRGSLDHILAQLLDKPLDTLQPQALTILRLGLYQLACLDRIPESAAVNESVNLAKELVPRAGGLINAVLRNYLRRKNDLTFPDPASNPGASIAARHSQPEWLVTQWLDQLDLPEAEALAEASSRQPPLTLRANTLRTTRDELLRLFTESGVSATPCAHSPHGIQVEGRHQLPTLPGYREGLFAVQDEASQMVALLLDPQPGERVLDCCAAPGGKATHLAQLLANRGELLATDISRAKLPVVREAAQRLGIDCLAVATADLHRPETLPTGTFDRVLLDAPCSGLGVIRRNPEAKWRLTPDDILRLAAAQKAMCANTATMVKDGGTLIYSTCSTSREENEEVVQDFLSRHPNYVLENLNELFPNYRELFTAAGMFRAWPHRHGMDGFFAARLRKS
ncbi:16S rRNA (cytosine(967)-C(5))-methyltransferase RsmB [Geobacter sp. AOG2]|uniref:16S rRNA (cytosine(967)-C(5))-methyltransferase RsmB n=1 Tax=Geobacter sp. AOG2 TaxID=1566347 RepID=UPI001CC4764D|nr:16S rRNA (cytosine(967)-C(5))-methyltransferase RsmB [Geobacter sp. AOG2]GFE62322.1 ribosomal RNA small subunit methyltransferase B [Geobacter sp. AOG2]